MLYRATPLYVVLLLSACGQNTEQAATPQKLFNEQRNALDKARAVDATQQTQADEQRVEVEKQTQ